MKKVPFMRTHFSVFLWAVSFLCISLTAGAAELWHIGSLDADYGEFAIAGRYAAFSTAFSEGVTFTVGKSDPARDWPFIQPGPSDVWAGSQPHTFTILFDLDEVPTSACRLMLALVSAQRSMPPSVTVTINGHACELSATPRGSGDEALNDPKAGAPSRQSFVFPSGWLKTGANQADITTTAGSWMLYDAVKLEDGIASTPDISRIEATCTPMFRKVSDDLRQAVRVRVENMGLSGSGMLSMSGEDGVEQPVEIPQGTANLMLLVPPFAQEGRRKITLQTENQSIEAEFDARPERQWNLYVAASAHTDIGYTDLQEKCMALHVDNAIAGLDAAATDPDFRWNLEVFAQYDWFNELKPERVADLDREIKSGKIGLTALYLNMLTGLCSGAEMMRLLAPAQACGRRLGAPVLMASLNDVPTSVGTLPMFLRNAGVRYFAEAINEDRGPVFMHCDPEMIQSPFWWEAPDGSRVLAIFTRTYFQVWQIKLHESMAAVEDTLPGFLDKFVREDYPGDAIFINGAFLDNCAMTPDYAKVAEEWNQTWDYPKFILSTPEAYFQHIEEQFGNDLPVYRGDMGTFWEDGAASSAAETAMVRWAKNKVATAEKWEALAAMRGTITLAPEGFGDIWKNILYYDEHTWGSAVSISDPNNPQSTGQWTRKAAYATKSLEGASAAQVRGLGALLSLSALPDPGDDNTVVVSNPLSWRRDVPVTLNMGTVDGTPVVLDKESGMPVLAQRTVDGSLFFVAKNVPAMGWRIYELRLEKENPAPELLTASVKDPFTYATSRLSFHINEKTGGLDRLTNLETGREWVDTDSGYHLNQFLHVSGGNGTAMIHPGHARATDLQVSTNESATVSLVENGPARAVLHIERTGGPSPVDTDLVIYADGTLDFINVIHKVETLEKEGGYFAFPFGMNTPDSATAYVELPYGIIAADQEQMPGACREWYTVNTFAAVGNAAQSAIVTAPDTPLFTVGDVNRGLWPNRNRGNRHVLFAYVYNNYWHTNYKASQGGDIRCAFSVSLAETPFDPVFATCFGWGRTLDLTPDSHNAVRKLQPAGAPTQSLVTLDEGSVLLSELLSLDSGKRVLARLYNPGFSPAETHLSLPGVTLTGIQRTDLFGENGAPLSLNEAIGVPARGIVTVVLQAE